MILVRIVTDFKKEIVFNISKFFDILPTYYDIIILYSYCHVRKLSMAIQQRIDEIILQNDNFWAEE